MKTSRRGFFIKLLGLSAGAIAAEDSLSPASIKAAETLSAPFTPTPPPASMDLEQVTVVPLTESPWLEWLPDDYEPLHPQLWKGIAKTR